MIFSLVLKSKSGRSLSPVIIDDIGYQGKSTKKKESSMTLWEVARKFKTEM